MEKVEYKFKVDIYKGLSAKDAYKELMSIRESNNGSLTPEAVVEASKDESSLLHQVFEWDNEKAAVKWRIEQAKLLIRNITVTVTTEKREVRYRAVVNIIMPETNERVYQPLQEVIADRSAYNALLQQAKDEAQDYLDRYSQLSELNGIKREMLKLINGINPEE